MGTPALVFSYTVTGKRAVFSVTKSFVFVFRYRLLFEIVVQRRAVDALRSRSRCVHGMHRDASTECPFHVRVHAYANITAP